MKPVTKLPYKWLIFSLILVLVFVYAVPASASEFANGVVDIINSNMGENITCQYVEEADCICAEFVLPGYTTNEWKNIMTDDDRADALEAVATIYTSLYTSISKPEDHPSFLMLSRLEDTTCVALYLDGMDISWMLS